MDDPNGPEEFGLIGQRLLLLDLQEMTNDKVRQSSMPDSQEDRQRVQRNIRTKVVIDGVTNFTRNRIEEVIRDVARIETVRIQKIPWNFERQTVLRFNCSPI